MLLSRIHCNSCGRDLPAQTHVKLKQNPSHLAEATFNERYPPLISPTHIMHEQGEIINGPHEIVLSISATSDDLIRICHVLSFDARTYTTVASSTDYLVSMEDWPEPMPEPGPRDGNGGHVPDAI